MKSDEKFPTLTETIERIIGSARYTVIEDLRHSDVPILDPTTIRRDTTCMTILRQAISHYAAQDDDTFIQEQIPAVIAEFNEREMTNRDVELRHPQVWFLYPVEVVHAQLNAMVYRNEQIKGVVSPQAFADFLTMHSSKEYSAEDLHKKSVMRAELYDAFFVEQDSATPFADAMQMFADEYSIHLNSLEKHELERKHTLPTICEYLTEKLHERVPNDGMVQYGRSYGGERLEQEREQFDRWGGIRGAATGLCVKHGSDLFEVLGSSYGVIDRVPQEDCTGKLAGAKAPIRIWLRTAPDEITNGSYGLGAATKEKRYYQQNPTSPHFDYFDHEAMLEDGWVLD